MSIKDNAICLFKQGLDFSQIASKINANEYYVRKILYKEGLAEVGRRIKPKKLTEAQKAKQYDILKKENQKQANKIESMALYISELEECIMICKGELRENKIKSKGKKFKF